jgi:hypothetical protein
MKLHGWMAQQPSLHEAAAWPAKVGSITPYWEREAGTYLPPWGGYQN